VIGVTPGFESTALMLCLSLSQTGPISVSDFDDEWAPTSEAYRDELLTGGLAEIAEGTDDAPATISLTGAGVALALGQAPVDAEAAPAP
jgi:hypothetical protein